MNKYTGNLGYPGDLQLSSLSLILPGRPLKSTPVDKAEGEPAMHPRDRGSEGAHIFSEAAVGNGSRMVFLYTRCGGMACRR